MEYNVNYLLKNDYVGQSWYKNTLNNDEKKEILNTYNEYQLNKLYFLNDRYDNIRTQSSYFSLYISLLSKFEIEKNKDIRYFSLEELENLIDNLDYLDTTKQNVCVFIRVYFMWCFKNKFIKKNTTENLGVSKSNSKKFIEDKIFGKDEFFNMIEEMCKNTNVLNVLPLVLARYGIVGDNLYNMINLKWEDINEEHMYVFIKDENGSVVCDLPIDERFIYYIKKAKNFTYDERKDKNATQYDDFGYVLKKAVNDNSDDKKIKYASVFNRVNEACKSINIKRISFKRLVLSRQLEILLEIRRYGRLQQQDLEYITTLFNFGKDKPIVNKSFMLKKRWEELTNDKVVTQRKASRNVAYVNSEEIYNNIKTNLGLYL